MKEVHKMKQITKVRKAVCAMANQLRKAGYSLKDAFKKGMAEGKAVNDSESRRNHIREQTGATCLPEAVQAEGFDRYTGKRKEK